MTTTLKLMAKFSHKGKELQVFIDQEETGEWGIFVANDTWHKHLGTRSTKALAEAAALAFAAKQSKVNADFVEQSKSILPIEIGKVVAGGRLVTIAIAPSGDHPEWGAYADGVLLQRMSSRAEAEEKAKLFIIMSHANVYAEPMPEPEQPPSVKWKGFNAIQTFILTAYPVVA